MKKAAALLVAMAMLLPVAAAATTPVGVVGAQGDTYTLHLTSLKEARFRNTIRQKYDFSCGSAAVATLLTYQYGYPVNEQTAFEQMYASGDKEKIHKEGFSLLDIKRFLAANGFQADGFKVPLQKLEDENLPAIVLIDIKGYHHFVVIKGVRDGRVLVGDPALGTRAIAMDKFMSVWKNGLVFVIHNRRNIAVFNSPQDWRVSPNAPLSSGIDRGSLYNMTMPKRGPGDI
ncbi:MULTISPECIES: C39 family peptidase [Dyella]|uniref:Peptidase C39 n=2 Tax=Dyella TaxID=231454 RepID=A0A4R0Z2N2_9GAMM|nr:MULTISPECIES: C39 family peptidase [Dyella]TBR39870.1 peptidase C39 [Dyella terrae]TCI12550.1 peptidase C39 [Dyella soli]